MSALNLARIHVGLGRDQAALAYYELVEHFPHERLESEIALARWLGGETRRSRRVLRRSSARGDAFATGALAELDAAEASSQTTE